MVDDENTRLRAALARHGEVIDRLYKARTEALVLLHEVLRGDVTEARRSVIARNSDALYAVGRPGIDDNDVAALADVRRQLKIGAKL